MTITVSETTGGTSVSFDIWGTYPQPPRPLTDFVRRLGDDEWIVQELGEIGRRQSSVASSYFADYSSAEAHIASVGAMIGKRSTWSDGTNTINGFYISDIASRVSSGHFAFGSTLYIWRVDYSIEFTTDRSDVATP
jgi:hypothetical protein